VVSAAADTHSAAAKQPALSTSIDLEIRPVMPLICEPYTIRPGSAKQQIPNDRPNGTSPSSPNPGLNANDRWANPKVTEVCRL
jgi:hypothetical protein